MITLEAHTRTQEDGALLRKKGFIPAVFYGKKTAATPVTLSMADFTKVWKTAGESSVVTLKTTQGNVDSLIKEVQVDPVSNMPLHVDFYVFEKGKKIEVSVPIAFAGVAPAVKDLGGLLVKVLNELKIEADPQHIPHEITVDLSVLTTIDSHVSAKDIILPKGVTLMELPEEVVAAVTPAQEEKEQTGPVDLSAIEVEKKGKKEEEAPEV